MTLTDIQLSFQKYHFYETILNVKLANKKKNRKAAVETMDKNIYVRLVIRQPSPYSTLHCDFLSRVWLTPSSLDQLS